MNLLCTRVLELMEMCLYAWDMFLELHKLCMVGQGGINRPSLKIVVWTEVVVSVYGHTGPVRWRTEPFGACPTSASH
jgi:hypothetical protein